MPRRTRRSWGAVRRLPSGRWQARWLDPETGELRAAPDTFASKADADAWLASRRTDLERGQALDPTAARLPLSVWADTFTATRLPALKPSTRADYEGLLRRNILPTFGRTPVSRIRPSDIDRWVVQLGQRLAPASVRRSYVVLRLVLEVAVRDRAIAANPCAHRAAPLPRSRPTERPVLSPAEVESLAEAMPRADRKLLVRLLAYGGLRIGEALALRRSSVNLKAGTLTVREALAEVNGRQHFGPTKSYETRTVPLPAALVAELREHLAGRPTTLDGSGFVFTSATGGPVRYRNFMRDTWHPAVTAMNGQREDAGLAPLRVTPHDLRSTCASLLIDAGASPKDVQAHLGHAEVTTTLKLYARVRPGRSEDLVSRMTQLLEEARATVSEA